MGIPPYTERKSDSFMGFPANFLWPNIATINHRVAAVGWVHNTNVRCSVEEETN